MINILCIVLAYIVGSVSSAILVCKLWGLPDPRGQGSHNPGATNVLRIGGKLPAVVTMLGDGAKGFVPTLLVAHLHFPSWVVGGVMLAALLGHIYPIFFGFKGGKGVATAMGAFLGLSWMVGGILIATWAGIIAVTRVSSLGAIIATLLIPVVGWMILHDLNLTCMMWLMSIILLIRHKDNIMRLYKGAEAKL